MARTDPAGGEILRLSERNWRNYRIGAQNHALRFINAVGFCYAFSPGPAGLPSLFEVWDLFERWLPDVVAQASPISHRAAAARVLEQYVRIAGAPRPADAASLFTWSPRITATAIADLQETGTLRIVRGKKGEDRLVPRPGNDRRRRP